jgi:hypothetical protein
VNLPSAKNEHLKLDEQNVPGKFSSDGMLHLCAEATTDNGTQLCIVYLFIAVYLFTIPQSWQIPGQSYSSLVN